MRISIGSWMLAAAVLCLAAGNGQGAEGPAKQDARLVVQVGHVGEVQAVAVSPNGKYILTAGDDNTARLWDAQTGMELLTYAGHTKLIWEVKFSSNGKYVLTGSRDMTARLWDMHTGKELRVFSGHTAEITSVAFSPDGDRVATSSVDATARVWDAQTGKELFALKEHTAIIHSVAFSPNGKLIVTGSADQTARLWDAKTGKAQLTLKGHTSNVWYVIFTTDSRRVLTGSVDKTARLWDAATGREIRVYKGHTGDVIALAVSSDEKHFATGSKDQTARVWDIGSEKEVLTFAKKGGTINAVAFSPNGKRIVTGAGGSTTGVWDARTGERLVQILGGAKPVNAVAFSRDGKQILVGAGSQKTGIWDVPSGKQLIDLHTPSRYGHDVRSVAFSPDGKRAVTTAENKIARVWDTQTGETLLGSTRAPNGKLLLGLWNGHDKRVSAVAYAPDGKHVLTGSFDKTARLWDPQTGAKGIVFAGHTDSVTSVAFSPTNADRILTGSLDKTARIWDVQTGKEIFSLKGHEGGVLAVAFSPDGLHIVTGSDDKTARLWDAKTGKELHTRMGKPIVLKGHTGSVNSVAFSAKVNHALVLTGSSDHTARSWNALTGKEQEVFKGHTSSVNSAVFSPDGKHVLTGCQDQTTALWNAQSGALQCRLITLNTGWAVVDAEGRYDASNGGDQEGLHWVVNLEPLALAQLKERYYEPGLLAKYLGFNTEPLRPVGAFRDVKLYPDIAVVKDDKKPAWNVTLTNRGGGIGKVVVLVNGKEKTGDARPRGVDDANAPKLEVPVDLSTDPRAVPGKKNKVEILAYNADDSLSSRGLVREFDAPGAAVTEKPKLYAVIVGVSKYRGDKINLKFAAKDAENFAKALKLGSERLFKPENVKIFQLTSAEGSKDVRPDRANLIKALEALKKTKPDDVVVVYLAGHGITHSGKNGENWYYLTADAQGGEMTDADREQVCLSSAELINLLKQSPAQKQVLILDTCHSGKVAAVIAERRDVPTSHTRALERMKDRTGVHVLAGCAANSVSYEDSRYGQGILTYSLLLGMKGACLEEGELVNVLQLFGFAADQVPELARGIGGVQRPMIASPKGTTTFYVGRMTAADQAQVPLQQVKPVVVRSSFLNKKVVNDDLELTQRVDARLRDLSAVPGGATMVFADAADMPGAVKAAGLYEIEKDKVTVRVTLSKGKSEVASFPVEGAASKPDDLAGKIAAEVEKRVAASGGK